MTILWKIKTIKYILKMASEVNIVFYFSTINHKPFDIYTVLYTVQYMILQNSF